MSENVKDATAKSEDATAREAYMAKLRQRLDDKSREAIFDVKEVGRDSQPFLIQCCIR